MGHYGRRLNALLVGLLLVTNTFLPALRNDVAASSPPAPITGAATAATPEASLAGTRRQPVHPRFSLSSPAGKHRSHDSLYRHHNASTVGAHPGARRGARPLVPGHRVIPRVALLHIPASPRAAALASRQRAAAAAAQARVGQRAAAFRAAVHRRFGDTGRAHRRLASAMQALWQSYRPLSRHGHRPSWQAPGSPSEAGPYRALPLRPAHLLASAPRRQGRGAHAARPPVRGAQAAHPPVPALHPHIAPDAPPPGAGTLVSGTISANTTWSLAGSPYVITPCVQIANNATLTIAPGVVVKVVPGASGMSCGPDANANLIVDGALVADGTATQPVVFTSNNDTSATAGGDTTAAGATTPGLPAPGDWGDIVFAPDAAPHASSLTYARVLYGQSVVDNNTSPTLHDDTLHLDDAGLAVLRRAGHVAVR